VLRLCTLTKCGFGSRVLEDRRVSESQRQAQHKSKNSGRSHVGVHRVESDIRSTGNRHLRFGRQWCKMNAEQQLSFEAEAARRSRTIVSADSTVVFAPSRVVSLAPFIQRAAFPRVLPLSRAPRLKQASEPRGVVAWRRVSRLKMATLDQ